MFCIYYLQYINQNNSILATAAIDPFFFYKHNKHVQSMLQMFM
jgi:hypothetical protein